jgi:hypothetical protein
MTGPIATYTHDMIQKLPPGRYAKTCPVADFTCGHWAHGIMSPEGNVILSGEFHKFIASKARGR